MRVDINSKGKHRARKNNAVQPNQVRYKFSVNNILTIKLMRLKLYWYLILTQC